MIGSGEMRWVVERKTKGRKSHESRNDFHPIMPSLCYQSRTLNTFAECEFSERQASLDYDGCNQRPNSVETGNLRCSMQSPYGLVADNESRTGQQKPDR